MFGGSWPLYDGEGAPGIIETGVENFCQILADENIDHFENFGVVNTTVGFPIAVTVDPGTHAGGTTATGSGSGTIT